MRVQLAALLVVAGCVRAPSRVDVATLVAERGSEGARRELTARVLDNPRDVQAHLALAALADKEGRPSEAIEQLEAVERLGGPLGTRWHDDDRARLGRLLLARGRARLARGAASALADLERAGALGAAATAAELAAARVAIAVGELRHSDARERAKGRAALLRVGTAPWRDHTPAERGAFGAWLWSVGARRAAYDELAAWHGATKPPRDEQLQAAYLRALAWWSPVWLGEAAPPPAEDLVGPERCWFPGADCDPPRDAATAALPAIDAEPRVAAVVRYAQVRASLSLGGAASSGETASTAALVSIARAFHRDPAIAERRGRELVARAVDAAAAQATLGALFDALGDPARARAAWQAAVDLSPEPAFLRGLAEAAARTGDGPAALVFATQASAASGDPAVVWTGVAAALASAALDPDALTAARNAIDLAGPEVLPHAFDVAIRASIALGRQSQADALAVQRAKLARLAARASGDGDAESRAALEAHRAQPTASTIARLWVASRAHPDDVELLTALLAALDPDDPRRATVIGELVVLAGGPDPGRALAAAAALRGR